MTAQTPLPALTPSRIRDRELWVGAFTIVGVVAVLAVLFILTDPSLFRGRYNIETVVDNAGGIRRGDPVQMLGVNIGRVVAFRLAPEGGVAVTLEVLNQYRIPADSRVQLRSGGLLGGLTAVVVPGTAVESVARGSRLGGASEAGIFEQLNAVQEEANRTLVRVQGLLDERTVRNVQDSGQDLRQLLRQLNEVTTEQRGELAAVSRSLRRSAEHLQQATDGPEIERSLARIDSLTARLDGVVASVDGSARSLESILGRIDRGEGSLGKLTRDEALYDHATEAVASLKQAADEFGRLAVDIREQPKKYVDLSLF